jgi:hypothetical protein
MRRRRDMKELSITLHLEDELYNGLEDLINAGEWSRDSLLETLLVSKIKDAVKYHKFNTAAPNRQKDSRVCGLANRIQKDCKEASALMDIHDGGKGDVKIPNSFTSALSDESERIGQALSNIGYHVIGIQIENACVAVDGSAPDLHIWVREQESSDAEVVKQADKPFLLEEDMNDEFLTLVRLLGDAGYKVRTIRRKKARIVSPEEVIIKGSKPLGDIVLRISPTAKTRTEVKK